MTLAKLNPLIDADNRTVQHSLMVFATLDDPVGAEIVAAVAGFNPRVTICASYCIQNDKMKFLRWAMSKCTFTSFSLCTHACESHSVAVLDYLDHFYASKDNGKVLFTEDLLTRAIVANNRTVIRWYVDRKLTPSRGAYGFAMAQSTLATLKYLFELNVPFYLSDVTFACNKDAATLDVLVAHGVLIPKTDYTMCNAASSYGNLETLRWCKERDCPWAVNTFWKALHANPPVCKELLDYLWTEGCPRPSESMLRAHMLRTHINEHVEWYCKTALEQ